MIGQTIQHYNILEKLGEGGMGVVYKAHDTKLDRTVALKFLPEGSVLSDEESRRFEQEARAAARLNHPHICTIHHFDEHEGQPYLVMEYVEGITLRESIREGQMSMDQALDFARQIAEALSEAHEAGIVHRDIKPENIMVDTKGRIKVMDFGLARLKGAEAITRTGSTVGTMGYMAPEQIQGEEVDHRSDIFSFGVVLYEMLTGQKPFRGEHEAALIYSIVNEQPDSITNKIGDNFSVLGQNIERCLEKNPNNRYTSIEHLLSDLNHFKNKSSSNQVSHPPLPPVLSGGGVMTILQSRASLFVILAVLVVLTGLFYYIFTSSPPTVSGQERQSIAVLPLENLSPDPDDAYFTDGMHEEIINRLAGIEELAVIARSSVLGYPPQDRDLRSIGDDIGVSAVMEGTVRRFSDRLRVSVQLIDVESLQTLWSGTYEDQLYDLLEIQYSIAGDVAEALEASLTAGEKQRLEERPTENPQAYIYFMQAREYLSRPGYIEDNYLIAIELLERALQEDPRFAHAYAALVEAYAYLYWFHGSTEERLEQMRKAVDRAELLEPNLTETHLARGIYLYWSNRVDNERTLSHFESSLQQFPNHPQLHVFSGLTHRRLGNWDQVEHHFRKAIDLDPRNANHYRELSTFYTLIADYDKAENILTRQMELAPDAPAFDVWTMLVTRRDGTLEGYESLWNAIYPEEPAELVPWAWGLYNYLKRDWNEALRGFMNIKEEVLELETFYLPRQYFMAAILEAMGDLDRAHKYYEQVRNDLEKLCNEQPNDPRYRATLGKVYARIDKPEQAITEGKKATELIPIEKNVFEGFFFVLDLAEIYAWTGRHEEALDTLEFIHSNSAEVAGLDKGWLKFAPTWDPLRDHPRFQKLLEELYSVKRGN